MISTVVGNIKWYKITRVSLALQRLFVVLFHAFEIQSFISPIPTINMNMK